MFASPVFFLYFCNVKYSVIIFMDDYHADSYNS
ncbi:hypothetical protein Premu_2609 [Hallella multisaccharivorax DSM 17128]|uniref:Uncharacterized protein n=1 Tax=Hallella multisaccharivorax DSM 17128 TaxID=688246 RepID=F8NBK1_9BACT|nr:hypothetical protein Premu_2609 [Hallella multisaccharivorax DSM 17128]